MNRPASKHRTLENWKSSLGIFTNFSPTLHGTARIILDCQTNDAKRALVRMLEELNGRQQPIALSVSGAEGEVCGTMRFEIGVAAGNYFVYLDEETGTELSKLILPDKPRPLDFLLVLAYYYKRADKEIPLKFDYYHLRLMLGKGVLNIAVNHVKGTRRVPIDDLLQMLFSKYEEEIRRLHLGTAKLDRIRTA